MITERQISLRPLRNQDKHELTELANNKKVADNLKDAFPHPYNESHAEFFIELSSKNQPSTNLAIEYEGRLCGVIGLVQQQDVYRRSAEIGYWIGEPYWNKGIATIAVRLMTDYGFNTLNLIRIHTGVFAYNVASIRVLEKNGYEKEGVFRKAITKNGKVWDEHRYAKIKE